MEKKFNREPIELKIIFFKKGKNIISEDVSAFHKKYNVHLTIQILHSDFKLIKKNMNRITHFNIQKTLHKPGKNYIIVQKHKTGNFDGVTYKQSGLDINNLILAKCLSVQNNINYIDLKDNIFKYSLSNIKNINALKKAIKRRYKKTLSHLSDTKKLSLGVGITELRIIKRL